MRKNSTHQAAVPAVAGGIGMGPLQPAIIGRIRHARAERLFCQRRRRAVR